MNHGIVHLIHRIAAACSGAGIAWSWAHYHNLFDQIVSTLIFTGAFLAGVNWNEIRRERDAKRKRKHSVRASIDPQLRGRGYGDEHRATVSNERER